MRPLSVSDAITQRRSVRAYTGDAVDAVCIEGLLDAAVQAPTAMHVEPWAFVVIQDKATLRRYSDRAKAMLLAESWQPGGEPALRHMAMLGDPAFNIFYDAGTLVVICRRITSPFADADCWLAAENLMLAATAQGLSTCCIGFAIQLLNAPDIKCELSIPDEGAAVAPIIIGHPRGAVVPVPRKSPVVLRWVK